MPDLNPNHVNSPIHADLDPWQHVDSEHAGEQETRHGQTQPNLQPHDACTLEKRGKYKNVPNIWPNPAEPSAQRVCTIVHLERKRGGGWCFFTQIEPNWPLPYSTMPVPLWRDARPAGWVTYCSICASTMLRAQNRAGIGSILLWRRLALAILFLFIHASAPCRLHWGKARKFKNVTGNKRQPLDKKNN